MARSHCGGSALALIPEPPSRLCKAVTERPRFGAGLAGAVEACVGGDLVRHALAVVTGAGRSMGTPGRTRIIGAICGLIVCAIGVGWLLFRGPQPFGTILSMAGAIFAASLIVSWWIYRSQK
jgi:hypothetical protein